MTIYVIAPIYNRKETTLKYLESFSNQSYLDYKMIIVDDGSTDGSSEAILSKFPSVKILKGNGNLWWTGSMNKGFGHVLSIAKDDDCILAMNDDVTVEQDYLERIANVTKESNAIVGSIYRDADNKQIIYDSGVKIDWERYKYNQVPFEKDKNFIENIDTLSTRGVLIPIKAIKKIGFFEKRLRHYAADYEYFLRAKKAGFQLILSYEAAVYGKESPHVFVSIFKNQNIFNIWKKIFGIKSSINIFNHLFIIWHHCPKLKYKIKNSLVIIFYYPFKFLFSFINMKIEKLMNTFNKILFLNKIGSKFINILMRIFLTPIFNIKVKYLDKAILINYEKYDGRIPNSRVGYLDIKEVERRYNQQMKNINIDLEVKNNASIRDNVFFIEQECLEYFKEKNNFNVLDVGCGSGVYSKIFSREKSPTRSWNYFGTEIDDNLVKLCKKYSPQLEFFTSTSEQIKSVNDNFDLVFSSGVMHYTLDSWKESILEMKRVTKKYIAILRFPLAKYSDTFYVKQTVESVSGKETHYFICINRIDFEKFLHEQGLMVLKRDYSSEEYKIKGVKEKIILNQYLLEKYNNI
jgi:GT2 family glycosyltransferase/ubiquinone/menaquinone biosynthesis C-methylase UbiE